MKATIVILFILFTHFINGNMKHELRQHTGIIGL